MNFASVAYHQRACLSRWLPVVHEQLQTAVIPVKMETMTIAELPIRIDPKQIAEFCRARGIRKLSLFGSVLREDFDAARSDVDVLAEFQPGVHPD